jgi:hypothetical protein
VGVRRSDHGGVGLAAETDVVDIAAAPGQKPRVLDPMGRLADAERLPNCVSGHFPPLCFFCRRGGCRCANVATSENQSQRRSAGPIRARHGVREQVHTVQTLRSQGAAYIRFYFRAAKYSDLLD